MHHVDKPGGTTGKSTKDHTTHGFSMGKESLKTSGCKNLWEFQWHKKLSASQERVCWRDPQHPRTYTNPPNKESAAEGSNLLVGLEGSG